MKKHKHPNKHDTSQEHHHHHERDFETRIERLECEIKELTRIVHRLQHPHNRPPDRVVLHPQKPVLQIPAVGKGT